MNVHEIRADVMPQVLKLLKSRLLPGCSPSLSDWKLAYDIAWAQAAIETAQWKIDNLTVGEYARSSDKQFEDDMNDLLGEPE